MCVLLLLLGCSLIVVCDVWVLFSILCAIAVLLDLYSLIQFIFHLIDQLSSVIIERRHTRSMAVSVVIILFGYAFDYVF